MLLTAEDSAVILAVMLKRNAQSRARISGKTIKFVAGRQSLRSAFFVELVDALGEYGWILFELPGGGYGVVEARALEAAKTLTAKRSLSEDEMHSLRKGRLNIEALKREAAPDDDENSEGDE
jgi:pantoate kinase